VSCSRAPRHLALQSPGIEPATFRLPDNCFYLLSYWVLEETPGSSEVTGAEQAAAPALAAGPV